jgi:hypothetical protein
VPYRRFRARLGSTAVNVDPGNRGSTQSRPQAQASVAVASWSHPLPGWCRVRRVDRPLSYRRGQRR